MSIHESIKYQSSMASQCVSWVNLNELTDDALTSITSDQDLVCLISLYLGLDQSDAKLAYQS